MSQSVGQCVPQFAKTTDYVPSCDAVTKGDCELDFHVETWTRHVTDEATKNI